MRSTVEAPDWSTIPAPVDDGVVRHFLGAKVPSISLRATDGGTVDLSALRGRVVVYAYPRTGRPGVENPEGWDMIPGARGCTPQACSFRDHFAELEAFGVDHLLDERLELTTTMGLPTFETSGMTLLKRFTLVIDDGTVEHVFYPVFPPDRSASEVIDWLSQRTRS